MKIIPNDTIKNIISSGNFIGENKPSGRVTVEPYWNLHATEPTYGDGQRGPYRWWLRDDGYAWEIEIPNIKSINIDRSVDQPIASCSISIYNQWHNSNTDSPELLSQLGKPGYFWFDRGKESDPESIQVSRWNQDVAIGGVDKDGNPAVDPVTNQPFNWVNQIIPLALLRTYQGYGGNNLSINAALQAGNLTQTGVWVIDRVTAGSDGMLNIECRDIGMLMNEQRLFPPLVPSHLYPLEYTPVGDHTYDSPWATQPTSLAGSIGPTNAFGFVPIEVQETSMGHREGSPYGNVVVDGRSVQSCIDNKKETWSWSHAVDSPIARTEWWQFVCKPNGTPYNVNQITLLPYGGGYTMYVSVFENGNWVPNGDGSLVPNGEYQDGVTAAIPYVDAFAIPMAAPGQERPITFNLPRTYAMTNVRLSFRFHQDLGPLPGGGPGYRCGIRDFDVIYVGPLVGAMPGHLPSDEYAAAIAPHPVSGYWAVSNRGNVWCGGLAQHYGNATEKDGWSTMDQNPIVGIAARPQGDGYWLLHANGHIEAKGAAQFWGRQTDIAYSPTAGPLAAYSLKAMGIAASYDGQGYWVIYSNGVVHGWGNGWADSTPVTLNSANLVYDNWWEFNPSTETQALENLSTRQNWPIKYRHKRGTAIASHPSALGYWAVDGCGVVRAAGACRHLGQFSDRRYNPGGSNSFRLGNTYEHIDGIFSTSSGDGYWMSSGSGRIAQFGDAIGRGIVDVYAEYRDTTIPEDPYLKPKPEALKQIFRSLAQGICRMSDDSGFYVVFGSGAVGAYPYNWWGNPAYWGYGSYRWHDGLFSDYTEIVKELLAWSGWALASMSGPPPKLPVHAFLENTGIATDNKISLEQIDKQTVLDVINQIREVVAYLLWVDSNGAVHFECVDEETEILTQSGWKTYESLSLEDRVYAFDTETGHGYWEKIDKINIYDCDDVDMVHLKSSSHDSLTTPNHRWWTRCANKNRGGWKWKNSEDIHGYDNIPVSAAIKDSEDVPKDRIDFAALVGWWISEGTYEQCGGNIVQSLNANPEKVEAIEALLYRLYGSWGHLVKFGERSREKFEAVLKALNNGESFASISSWSGVDRHTISGWKRNGLTLSDYHEWNKTIHGDIVRFYLPKSIVQELDSAAYNKIPSYEWLISLSKKELDAFIGACMEADGHTCAKGYGRWTQKLPERLEAFEFACSLAGISTTRTEGKRASVVTLKKLKYANPVSTGSKEIVKYTGKVWCPTLKSNFVWLARRNGKQFFTGNSPNIWRSGNYITSSIGGDARVHTDEIPVLDERVNLISYSATADGQSYLYEIIVGSDVPLFTEPTRTAFYRFKPPNTNVALRQDGAGPVYLHRNILKQALWTSEFFSNPEEIKLLAEMTALSAFFAQRSGSARIIANPAIEINDQVKIVERNTAEAYIHYVKGISSTMDLDTGEYTMNLTTNWMGTSNDNWVITRDNVDDPLTRVQITERQDRWQTVSAFLNTREALVTGQLGSGGLTDRIEWTVN